MRRSFSDPAVFVVIVVAVAVAVVPVAVLIMPMFQLAADDHKEGSKSASWHEMLQAASRQVE